MPSSISSFEVPGLVRRTASDRPGEAQPVPERDIPAQPWGPILLGGLALMLALLAGWEWYWRDFGATPGYRNDESQWSAQRRRINLGEGGGMVLVGSSRVLFDVQLPVWERLTGERPIQLALEGTSPVPVLEDLAADPDFTGQLLIGVAPDVFFSGFAYRAGALKYFYREGPGQRVGHWLSQRLIEPYVAFYDGDFALSTVLARQPWPLRPGTHPHIRVRKLMQQEADRNSHMWSKVETDPQYRALARSIWAADMGEPLPGMATPQASKKVVDTQIARAVKALATLRARGVKAVFLRAPSDGAYLAYENKYLPRADSWDLLLARTATPGIHFEDYPQLQHYELPEWSHLSAADAQRFTAALVPIVAQTLPLPAPGRRATPR